VNPRRTILVTAALAIGLTIAAIDASPGWDSTGITAGLLLLGAGAVAAIAGDRPWLWALLVGLPTPVLEVRDGGSAGALLAVAFAIVGAAVGWLVAGVARVSAEGSTRE
jgi:hypothetical protein